MNFSSRCYFIFSRISSRELFRTVPSSSSIIRLCSSHRKKLSGVMTALSPDESTYLCWHPEPEFPYEHTRPLPRNEQESQQGDSVLKVQHITAENQKYSPDGPSDRELAKMFHTTRHPWDPKPKKRFAKDNPPKDRDGI